MDNQRAPLFAAAAVVVAAILLIVILVLPKMSQVSTAKEDLAEAQQQEQTLQTQKAALLDLQAEAPQNKAIIKDVHHKIPPTADEPGLIRLINSAASDAGLDLTTLAPSPPVFDPNTGLSTIVLTMSAVGTYNETTSFSYQIETLPRAAKITSLSLSPTGESDSLGNTMLAITVQIDAFTSDASAGPGSVPGATDAADAGEAGA